MLSIHSSSEVARLTKAGSDVLALIQSGEMFADTEEAKAGATEAADRLEQAISRLMEDDHGHTRSPFHRYREEILGGYGTAAKLRALVMHLWNSSYQVRLANLFGCADEHHTRIALELIVSYTRHGERDPNFMNLADHIRANFKDELK